MTAQTLVVNAITGLAAASPTATTLKVVLFNQLTPNTLAYTSNEVRERTVALTEYVATFTTLVAAGKYNWSLRRVSSETPIVTGSCQFTGVDGEVASPIDNSVNLDSITGVQLAALTLEPNVVINFPSSLIVGDSYTANTVQIKIAITNSNGDPVTGVGTLLFSTATVTFTAFRPNDSALISGTCTFVNSGTETYVLLSLLSSETIKAKPEFTYEGRLKFDWPLVSEQKTYPTEPFKFIANP